MESSSGQAECVGEELIPRCELRRCLVVISIMLESGRSYKYTRMGLLADANVKLAYSNRHGSSFVERPPSFLQPACMDGISWPQQIRLNAASRVRFPT